MQLVWCTVHDLQGSHLGMRVIFLRLQGSIRKLLSWSFDRELWSGLAWRLLELWQAQIEFRGAAACDAAASFRYPIVFITFSLRRIPFSHSLQFNLKRQQTINYNEQAAQILHHLELRLHGHLA